jgi:hypothetical protein
MNVLMQFNNPCMELECLQEISRVHKLEFFFPGNTNDNNRKLEMIISVVTHFEGCASQMGTLWNVTALTCHPFRIIRMKASHVTWVCLQI